MLLTQRILYVPTSSGKLTLPFLKKLYKENLSGYYSSCQCQLVYEHAAGPSSWSWLHWPGTSSQQSLNYQSSYMIHKSLKSKARMILTGSLWEAVKDERMSTLPVHLGSVALVSGVVFINFFLTKDILIVFFILTEEQQRRENKEAKWKGWKGPKRPSKFRDSFIKCLGTCF